MPEPERTVVGTCSLCEGPVTRTKYAASSITKARETVECGKCGAAPKLPHGPKIEMVRTRCSSCGKSLEVGCDCGMYL